METENLSTAASRFDLRSTTELVGDKEQRPAPKPSSVATLASAIGAPALVAIFAPNVVGLGMNNCTKLLS